MNYFCQRCKRSVDKLISIGDPETTAWVSSENRIPMPYYNYVCVDCAMEILGIQYEDLPEAVRPIEIELMQEIDLQKNLMIAVATGGPRINEKNDEYKQRRLRIKTYLRQVNETNPNPYSDLWAWYGKWSSGDLPSYQSRREYIGGLYQPLLEKLASDNLRPLSEPVSEPTGWVRVDRSLDKVRTALEQAKSEEDFQGVGFLCRETIISLAQAVYDPENHRPLNGVVPSNTDANRMLEAFFANELKGSSNENARKHARSALALANELQHRRSAKFRDSALCAEATRTVVNVVAIVSGKRDEAG